MTVRIDRLWSREIPAEWDKALRAFSPITPDLPWLTLRWHAASRKDKNGIPHDCGRWVMVQCVPKALVLKHRPENDIFVLLGGCPPSRFKDPEQGRIRATWASDYQCRMYREHNVWAKDTWIIQGSDGGHPITYNPMEEAILKAYGLPTDPPPLGALPYAPLDRRVFDQLAKRDRRRMLGGMSSTSESVQKEFDEAEREFRRIHVQQLESSMAASADFLDYYTSSSKTSTEARNTLPQMSQADQALASVGSQYYVETGALPSSVSQIR